MSMIIYLFNIITRCVWLIPRECQYTQKPVLKSGVLILECHVMYPSILLATTCSCQILEILHVKLKEEL